MNIDSTNFEVNVTNLWGDSDKYDCKASLIKRYGQLQSRKAFLRDCIRQQEINVASSKEDSNLFWERAVPDTPEGRVFFEAYSSTKKLLKQDKKELKQLIELQQECKAEMQEVSNLLSEDWFKKLVG